MLDNLVIVFVGMNIGVVVLGVLVGVFVFGEVIMKWNCVGLVLVVLVIGLIVWG